MHPVILRAGETGAIDQIGGGIDPGRAADSAPRNSTGVSTSGAVSVRRNWRFALRSAGAPSRVPPVTAAGMRIHQGRRSGRPEARQPAGPQVGPSDSARILHADCNRVTTSAPSPEVASQRDRRDRPRKVWAGHGWAPHREKRPRGPVSMPPDHAATPAGGRAIVRRRPVQRSVEHMTNRRVLSRSGSNRPEPGHGDGNDRPPGTVVDDRLLGRGVVRSACGKALLANPTVR